MLNQFLVINSVQFKTIVTSNSHAQLEKSKSDQTIHLREFAISGLGWTVTMSRREELPQMYIWIVRITTSRRSKDLEEGCAVCRQTMTQRITSFAYSYSVIG